jgi:hypothetical protein
MDSRTAARAKAGSRGSPSRRASARKAAMPALSKANSHCGTWPAGCVRSLDGTEAVRELVVVAGAVAEDDAADDAPPRDGEVVPRQRAGLEQRRRSARSAPWETRTPCGWKCSSAARFSRLAGA